MPTFLITGASSGIGLALALTALRRGHRVIGTTRDPSKASVVAPDFEKLGGTWLALDISDPSSEASVKAAGEREKIDVLVNGAGYALLGPIENVSDAEAQAQMDTNFHGYLRTIRALVPGFRARRSGTIVNISSGGGFIGRAGRGLYVASKFAVEGLSESLADELAPFGVRVILAQPGAFRTSFLDTLVMPEAGVGGYEDTPAGALMKMAAAYKEMKLGDTGEAAGVLLDVILGTGLGGKDEVRKALRVPLGQDVWPLAKTKAQNWLREIEVMEGVANAVGKET